MARSSGEPVLEVRDLSVGYRIDHGVLVPAVRDVTITVGRGEIVGVVGESGCGKSTLATAILRLLPKNAEVMEGELLLDGQDLKSLTKERLRRVRGREMAAVFQDPLTSLNPTLSIGTQLIHAQRAHGSKQRKGALRRTAALALTEVGLPDPDTALSRLPHELSGGMQQRVVIALALLGNPILLIADEPTSALDVTLQMQVLQLFQQVRVEHGTAVLFISHDLGAIAQLCDRVVVMYAGEIVEEGDVYEVFRTPKHPYTRALLGSLPSVIQRGDRLSSIPGYVPMMTELPKGCAFAARCKDARPACTIVAPSLLRADGRTLVRCHQADPKSIYYASGEDVA